jgi:hypothetical protein
LWAYAYAFADPDAWVYGYTYGYASCNGYADRHADGDPWRD